VSARKKSEETLREVSGLLCSRRTSNAARIARELHDRHGAEQLAALGMTSAWSARRPAV